MTTLVTAADRRQRQPVPIADRSRRSGPLPLVVFPVVTGATGKERIFDGYPDIALDLVGHRMFDGRLQLLEYVPTALDGPPAGGD